MKFTAPHLPASELYTMRRLGYVFIDDRRTGKQSYVRSLRNDHYPRFHIYVTKAIGTAYVFDIHLDQKEASYEGSRMHSGEHEGAQVEAEVARIKKELKIE